VRSLTISYPLRRAGLHFGSIAAAVLICSLGSAPALAQDDAVSALIEQDRRLAGIAERLLKANAPLCRQEMPLLGMVMNSRDQYQADRGADLFANGDLVVTAILPDSPAAAAGLRTGDALVEIAGKTVSALPLEGEEPRRDAAFRAIVEAAGAGGIDFKVARSGQEWPVHVQAPQGCRALVEILADDSSRALSDGRVIQVSYGLAQRASDTELAVVFAHELGHLVLEHRRRLEGEGVEKGLLGEFGKNQRLNREVEVEADRISVHLLLNAGYDPEIAPRFWDSALGKRVGGGLLRMSTTYPNPAGRAAQLRHEIADYLAEPAGYSWPGHLLGRRQP